MSEFRRRLMMAGQNDDGLVLLDYIQSDGLCCIDTGVSGNNDNLNICVGFIMTKHQQWGAVFSNYVDENSNAMRYLQSGVGTINATFNRKAGGATKVVYSAKNDLDILFNISQRNAYVYYYAPTFNGNVSLSGSSGTANNRNIALFAGAVTTTSGADLGLKLYYCRIFDNGTLIRDFVPVAKNGVGYLLNRVDGSLFPNTSVGSFILGNERAGSSPIEYLQSDGTAYIDTGIQGGNDNLEIYIKFSYGGYINYAPIYGNYVGEGYNATRFILGTGSNGGIVNVNTYTGGSGNTPITISQRAIHEITASKSSITVDGNSVSVVTGTGTANNSNIVLFQRALSTVAGRDIFLRVYGMQIRDNGVLVRDFIPWRRGNVGYMYDNVTHQFFGAVEGTFIFGDDITL